MTSKHDDAESYDELMLHARPRHYALLEPDNFSCINVVDSTRHCCKLGPPLEGGHNWTGLMVKHLIPSAAQISCTTLST